MKCSYEGTLDGKPVAELLPEKPMFGKQANTWEEAGNQTGNERGRCFRWCDWYVGRRQRKLRHSFPRTLK